MSRLRTIGSNGFAYFREVYASTEKWKLTGPKLVSIRIFMKEQAQIQNRFYFMSKLFQSLQKCLGRLKIIWEKFSRRARYPGPWARSLKPRPLPWPLGKVPRRAPITLALGQGRLFSRYHGPLGKAGGGWGRRCQCLGVDVNVLGLDVNVWGLHVNVWGVDVNVGGVDVYVLGTYSRSRCQI